MEFQQILFSRHFILKTDSIFLYLKFYKFVSNNKKTEESLYNNKVSVFAGQFFLSA